jgi:hypothetical protein
MGYHRPMTDTPPTDPADHARDFAIRWADRLEIYAGVRMEELGIPSGMIGSSDYKRGVAWRAFYPHEIDGGGVAPGGRISVDSGVLNPELHPVKEWADANLRHRFDAAIAHEYEEAMGGSHEYAVEYAPETDLPVGGEVRKTLRAIRLSEQGFRGGGSNRTR